jgi:predicted small integral membrane protein
MMKKLIIIVFLAIFVFPTSVFAQGRELVWSQGECDQLEEYSGRLCDLLWTVQQILYAVGIGLAGIMVILGGITYMGARDSEEQTAKAKKMITNGLIGFAIVIGFALIMGLVRGIVSQTLL